MGTYIKGRIKKYPSGLTSVIFGKCVRANRSVELRSGAPSLPYVDFETGELIRPRVGAGGFICYPGGTTLAPWQSCQTSARETDDRKDGGTTLPGLPPGKGGLGRKSRASWKTCRNARERMAAAEIEYGISSGLLLTVTLPSVDERSFEALARYSSYAMDRLNRELNREFKGKDFARVSVWEYQKRGALHCHIYIAGNGFNRICAKTFSDKYAGIWYGILGDIESKFPCNMFQRKDGKRWKLRQLRKVVNKKKECVFVNCQKVRKSVVAYLSEYLTDSNHEEKSKGKNALREKFYPIATWMQWNRKATELFHKYMIEIDLGECEIDKGKAIEKELEKLEKDINKRVILADKTSCIHAKNPYNLGFYWIPEYSGSLENKRVIDSFVDRIKPLFRESLLSSSPCKEDDEDWLDIIPNSSYRDDFLGLVYDPLEVYRGGYDACQEWASDWADFLVGFSLEMIDFFERVSNDKGSTFHSITGTQLCLI